ncbi:hypothetical protein V5735_09600 (plasmid) [Haladaptatus sp. SPP-AMP-3]|uniref:hypothetical protein n=1 Tax=Haladaptatus sp. SPP-AMP-3 TaxID=3121295 RepID=UPI003C2ECB64
MASQTSARVAVRLPFARLLLTVFAAVPLLAGIVGFREVVVFVPVASVTMRTPGKPWLPRR